MVPLAILLVWPNFTPAEYRYVDRICYHETCENGSSEWGKHKVISRRIDFYKRVRLWSGTKLIRSRSIKLCEGDAFPQIRRHGAYYRINVLKWDSQKIKKVLRFQTRDFFLAVQTVAHQ